MPSVSSPAAVPVTSEVHRQHRKDKQDADPVPLKEVKHYRLLKVRP
jgi:hypothetical protein